MCLADQTVEAEREETAGCLGIAEVHNVEDFCCVAGEGDGVLVSWHNLCGVSGRCAVGLEDVVCCAMICVQCRTKHAVVVSVAAMQVFQVECIQQDCIVNQRML
jgi:hypothetical protein